MSEKDNSLNEWTLMFLFAGDNELAPLLISQVKAIKDAGFDKNVEVLVHFDPNERGVPTRLLRVNNRRKSASESPKFIGLDNSFVRNMGEDIVTSKQITPGPGDFFSSKMKESLDDPDGVTSLDALKNFLGYCRESHPAKNYMLFLFGHGMVVGGDAFLTDSNPGSAVTLGGMGDAIKDFTKKTKGKLHLLGLHSCAISAVEVAYELKGTAQYMIGSEGLAWVGSWPYLNLLMKIFKALEDEGERRGRRGLDAAGA